ncbi:GMP synthase [glutamine-hydrolyzing] [uncultured Candidatus Thioglobus sp.]|nr:GMP synthase [glutamine-hydrolyzing] [uncultured Candidatus Thioglobus sp.]
MQHQSKESQLHTMNNTSAPAEKILILDFGSQYTQLIARRVREAGVYSEIHAFNIADEFIKNLQPKAIILSGGPASATVAQQCKAPEIVFQLGVPVLGICYGMQTMAQQLGGAVEISEHKEFGYAQVRARGHSKLLTDIQDQVNQQGHGLLDVWMSHGDTVTKLPTGFKLIASTEHAPIAGIADEQRKFYGLQFHPEVTHTKQGQTILQRFLYQIADCQKLWNIAHIINTETQKIRATAGKQSVLLGLSGGVDSAVAAAILQQAIGEQLICVFVDNGLLRLNEGDQIIATFSELGIKVIRINAAERFITALKGIIDPEQKRKIIGKIFIEIFQQQAKQLQNIQWLAQGTIYSDVIESANAATGQAQVIKTHHNVGGLPADMQLKLIEPLRELFKDEVRQLGIQLGIPKTLIERHPFPGPGFGVRILGEVRQEYIDLLRQADAIYTEALQQSGLYHKVSQAFAVFLPVKSVGVMGDARHYDFVIALRAVETIDFMTARWARLPHEFLESVSNQIINQVSGIARVVYDISSKPPATIEWE